MNIYPDYVLNSQLPLYIFKKALIEYRDANTLVEQANDLVEKERKNYILAAIEKFNKCIDLDPNFADAYHDWGIALFECEKYDGAIEKFKKCIDIEPDNSAAYFNWGLCLENLEMYEDAIGKYEQCIKLNSVYIVDAHFQWGFCLEKLKMYEDVIGKYEKCIDIEPEFVDAHYRIAYTLEYQGKYRLANEKWNETRTIYERGIQTAKDFKDTDFFLYFGEILCCTFDELDEAEAIYKEGLRLEDDNVDILTGLVHLYYVHFEEYWRAVAAYNKTEIILKNRLSKKEDIDIFFKLGRLYFEMDEFEDAEKMFLKVFHKDKEYEEILLYLGILYANKEDFEKSIKYFESAIKRDSDNIKVKSRLAEAYLKGNLLDKAEIEYNKILKITHFHVESQIGLGQVYKEIADISEDEDDYDKAMNYFNEAIKISKSGNGSTKLDDEELADIHYFMGYVRYKLYKISKDIKYLDYAKEDFKVCFEKDPNNFKAKHNKEKIERFLDPFSYQMLTEKIGPGIISLSAIFIFIVGQILYLGQIFGRPKYIEITDYLIITFASLIVFIIGIYLPQVFKLKFAGVEIEKIPVGQISPHTFDIKKPRIICVK